MVFYLSGLTDRLASLVDSIFIKYGQLELMGQKVSSKVLKRISLAADSEGSQAGAVDCPASKFKCLRGNLSEEETENLLMKVEQGKMSFAALEKECKKIKDLKDLQHYVIEQAGCESWEEAKER